MDYKYYHDALTLYYYPVKGLSYEPGIIIQKIGECLSRSVMTNKELDQLFVSYFQCVILRRWWTQENPSVCQRLESRHFSL